jgi:uncharacterized protein YdiU (UPF0061 family)
MKHTIDTLPLSNSFAALGDKFFSRVTPTPFQSDTHLVHFNARAALLLDLNSSLHLDPDAISKLIDVLSGKQLFPQSDPVAMLYAGHQFGHYVPQLGDGRAILLGETINKKGERWEIQLKGSGITPYSRDGDGRAVLRSTIREYLCSEAMHALGIPTTRALGIIGSDEEVYRERIEPGAILTRLAPSHIRFGSFEVFYYRNQFDEVRKLADYVIKHHYPDLADKQDRYILWFEEIINRTASLIAQWQAVGFCHGVMNSDNMSVLGLTLDYGPYGFMEAFDPHYVCNHSDYAGRYAYDQQPNIGLFNLSCFAQAILPIFGDNTDQAVETAKSGLATYQQKYIKHYAEQMRHKLGLITNEEIDELLTGDLLALMAQDKVDFTILFRKLCEFTSTPNAPNNSIRDLFIQRNAFDQWAQRYKHRLVAEHSNDQERQIRMKKTNPKFVLRNYLAEQAIRKAEDEKDYTEMDRLFGILQSPYDEQPGQEDYAAFPPDWASSLSVSCSS